MDAISPKDLEPLLAPHPSPCISIYAATHPSGREGENDPLRLEELIDEAQEHLEAQTRRNVDARDFVAPLRALVTDEAFWHDRSDGVVAFLAANFLRTYRLPERFSPRVSVSSHFVIRPLLPYLVHEDRFVVLALSQHCVRLFHGNRRQVTPWEAPRLPARMETLIATDQGRKQVHIGGGDPSHRHSAIYHGHGGKPDARKDEIEGFLRSLGAPLSTLLPRDGTPVILAGVSSLLAIFRRLFAHPALSPLQLEKNCDHLSEAKLHAHVWPLVQAVVAEQALHRSAKAFADAGDSRCSVDPHVIVPAAHFGGVELLTAARDASLYGHFDRMPNVTSVEIDGENAEDLVDLAAADTLRNRGRVFIIDRDKVPGCTDMAAVLRRGWAVRNPSISAQQTVV
mgnify:CR=1 FL=1